VRGVEFHKVVTETEASLALEGISQSFSANGYQLSIAAQDGILTLTVEARGDACADCLVPQPLMAKMIEAELYQHRLFPARVELRYPREL
jgi:hypothetical protein